jgi:hypothetical protein
LVKPGDRDFRDRLARCDHIAVVEVWCGWEVLGHWHSTTLIDVGPFRTHAAATVWLRDWLGDVRRPLTVSMPGSWHWRAGDPT